MEFDEIDTKYLKGRAYPLPLDHPIGKLRFDDTMDEMQAIQDWAAKNGVTLRKRYYRQRTTEYGKITKLEIVSIDYKPAAFERPHPMHSHA